MTRRDHLFTQREHLKDAREGHRQRLGKLWEEGKQETWLYKKLMEQYNLMEDKIDNINDELVPWPKLNPQLKLL